MWEPLDLSNPIFEKVLQERGRAPTQDFIRRNIVRSCITSTTFVACRNEGGGGAEKERERESKKLILLMVDFHSCIARPSQSGRHRGEH